MTTADWRTQAATIQRARHRGALHAIAAAETAAIRAHRPSAADADAHRVATANADLAIKRARQRRLSGKRA